MKYPQESFSLGSVAPHIYYYDTARLEGSITYFFDDTVIGDSDSVTRSYRVRLVLTLSKPGYQVTDSWGNKKDREVFVFLDKSLPIPTIKNRESVFDEALSLIRKKVEELEENKVITEMTEMTENGDLNDYKIVMTVKAKYIDESEAEKVLINLLSQGYIVEGDDTHNSKYRGMVFERGRVIKEFTEEEKERIMREIDAFISLIEGKLEKGLMTVEEKDRKLREYQEYLESKYSDYNNFSIVMYLVTRGIELTKKWG